MLFAVKSVVPKSDFLLHLTFTNNEEKLFDMKPYLNTGIFKELTDVSIFNTVKVNFDTIEWANKADIDPETLYEDGVKL